jgi:hypothetical protein
VHIFRNSYVTFEMCLQSFQIRKLSSGVGFSSADLSIITSRLRFITFAAGFSSYWTLRRIMFVLCYNQCRGERMVTLFLGLSDL